MNYEKDNFNPNRNKSVFFKNQKIKILNLEVDCNYGFKGNTTSICAILKNKKLRVSKRIFRKC